MYSNSNNLNLIHTTMTPYGEVGIYEHFQLITISINKFDEIVH